MLWDVISSSIFVIYVNAPCSGGSIFCLDLSHSGSELTSYLTQHWEGVYANLLGSELERPVPDTSFPARVLGGANICEGFWKTVWCNNVLNGTSKICQSSFVRPLTLTKYTNLSRISSRQVMCLGMFFFSFSISFLPVQRQAKSLLNSHYQLSGYFLQ